MAHITVLDLSQLREDTLNPFTHLRIKSHVHNDVNVNVTAFMYHADLITQL